MTKVTQSLNILAFFIVFIVASLLIDLAFKKLGIPIVVGDLFLIPLALLVIYIFIYLPIFNRKNFFQKERSVPLFYLPFGMVLMAMAAWGISAGITEPTALFTGTGKPAAHGYSLALLSVGTMAISIIIMWASIRRFFKHK